METRELDPDGLAILRRAVGAPKTKPHRHHLRKLTPMQVTEAAELRTADPKRWTYRALAERYGVHTNTIQTALGVTTRARKYGQPRLVATCNRPVTKEELLAAEVLAREASLKATIAATKEQQAKVAREEARVAVSNLLKMANELQTWLDRENKGGTK